MDGFNRQVSQIRAPPAAAIRYGKNYCETGLLQWRHNERDGVSNHTRLDCLLSRLFRRRSKKTWKLRVTDFCEGNGHGWAVDSPHNGPERRKLFPFDDVMMNVCPQQHRIIMLCGRNGDGWCFPHKGTVTAAADSRFSLSQWETVLLCNDVSHWLGASLKQPCNSTYGMTLLWRQISIGIAD